MVRSLPFLAAVPAVALIPGPWSDTSKSSDERTALVVANLTLEEKLSLLHGPDHAVQCGTDAFCAYVGNVAGNTRLDLPPINMADGPQGFRADSDAGDVMKGRATSTSWPSGLTMAASWDLDALYQWGAGMGKEFYAKGANVQLGPGLCLARVPRNGRNFEYLSGEDPFLGSALVGPVIRGIQDQKVVANAKHFVFNNQETNRFSVTAEVEERTRFEMYYPPFQGAVDAGVGSIMCSYNKIQGKDGIGRWSCENPETLRELKEKLGFKGYVMSDWGAAHSTSLMAGLDMEMPAKDFMNPEEIKAGLDDGTITSEAVDEAATRILRPMFDVGVLDEPGSAWDWNKLDNNVTTEEAVLVARHLSQVSTVLLKNDGGVLPLNKGQRLAVLGFADVGTVVHAGGSGRVFPSYVAKPLDTIRAAAGEGAEVHFNDGTDISAATQLARDADVAIVFVATLSQEGQDRASLSLDDGCEVNEDQYGDQCKGNADRQNALVAAVAAANPKTVVVASVPGAVLMPWSRDVAAILTNFMPGQQAGFAIADILFGKANPSGKLPVTFPNVENETEFTPSQWPGLPEEDPEKASYSEALLVGYRYYDAKDIQFSTGFPFGHGLSYTDFEYGNLTVSQKCAGEDCGPDESPLETVAFDVRNVGTFSGADVAQVYLGFPIDAGEPPLQLKGFEKTKILQPGHVQRVEVHLNPDRDCSIWDTATHSWTRVPGTFDVKVGASSRDIRLSGKFSQMVGLVV